METDKMKKIQDISEQDLAHLGGGALAYIREIEGQEASRLLGKKTVLAANAKMFCLYNADGSPISISGTREAAIGSAFEHELMQMSVH